MTMDHFWIIVGAALLVYICRASGFVLNLKAASPVWERFLHFVPIAIFSVLVVSAMTKQVEMLDFKLVALAFAGFIIWRTRQFGLAVIAGIGVLWVLTAIGGSAG